jgi:glyoxylase-like metal-dependent hydrolase (beta-lactamase superfamily II)
MTKRLGIAILCSLFVCLAAWYGGSAQPGKDAPAWTVVVPGVLRSPGAVAGYALFDGERALLIDAPAGTDGLAAHGVRKVDAVLLTHYHRDVCTALPALLKSCPVRAPVKRKNGWNPIASANTGRSQSRYADRAPLIASCRKDSRASTTRLPTGEPSTGNRGV